MGDRNGIVVVDDSPAALRLLFDTLSAEGYAVRPANSGQAALAAIAALPPELILMDVAMPGMDGLAVCRQVKSQAEVGDIPVLLISGSTAPEQRSAGFTAGAVDFILKPFQREELLARIRTHLELSRLRRSLEQQVQAQTEQLRAANQRLQVEMEERLALEARLRQSEKMEAIGQLASGVAHDFNNQLTGIQGFADLLAQRVSDPAKAHYVDNIIKAAHRSADLTQKLLTFARKGRQVTMRVDVHEVINDALALVRALDKRIEICLELEAQPLVTSGDPAQLQNAILNLAINARDAMPNGGQLHISTRQVVLDRPEPLLGLPAGRYVRVVVADTGIGIDAETAKHVFEPFFTTKPAGKGTGLGLATVYGTVMRHQGAIALSSEVGKGTAVTIHLPLEVADHASGSTATTLVRAVAPARILLADSDEIVRELTATMLTGLGYQVSTCADGTEALAFFRAHWSEVDIAILGLAMPGLDGAGLFHAMRVVNPAARILLFSGGSMTHEVHELLAAGALGFIHKPFGQYELSQKVAAALAATGPARPRP